MDLERQHDSFISLTWLMVPYERHTKETYKRDIQKRQTKSTKSVWETYKRDTHRDTQSRQTCVCLSTWSFDIIYVWASGSVRGRASASVCECVRDSVSVRELERECNRHRLRVWVCACQVISQKSLPACVSTVNHYRADFWEISWAMTVFLYEEERGIYTHIRTHRHAHTIVVMQTQTHIKTLTRT